MKKVTIIPRVGNWALGAFSFVAGPVAESVLYQVDFQPFAGPLPESDDPEIQRQQEALALMRPECAIISVADALALLRALEPATEDEHRTRAATFELQRGMMIAALEAARKPGVQVSLLMSDA